MKKIIASIKPGYLLFAVTLFILANLFVFLYVKSERYIYFWDYSTYWDAYRVLPFFFSKGPLPALHYLADSIRNDEYNLFSIYLLAPFRFVFGESRTAYILAVTNLFAVPSVLAFLFFFEKKSNWISYLSVAPLILLPQFWTPVLRGYVDVVGIMFIFIILAVTLSKPIDKLEIKKILLLSFLLTIMVVLRRYYLYWSLTFVPAYFILSLQKSGRQGLISITKRSLFIIVFVCISLLILMPQLIKNINFTQYATSAYRSYSEDYSQIGQNFIRFAKSLGYLYIGLVVGGAIYLLKIKKNAELIFLSIQFLVIFILFSRTQDFNTHHYYLLIPTVALLASVFLTKNREIAIISVLILGLNFLTVFSPNLTRYTLLDRLLSSDREAPLVRDDLLSINKILDALVGLSVRDEDTIYVLASSITFNDDILRHACVDRKMKFCDRILLSSHIDKRDPFPDYFYDTKYFLVADPIQLHLRPEEQQVIIQPAKALLAARWKKDSYVKLPYVFRLDNNVKVYIYQYNVQAL